MGIVSDLSQGEIPCVPQRFSQLTHDLARLLLFRPVFYLMSDLNVNQAPHGRTFTSIGALPWPAETQSPVNPCGFLMDTVAFYSGAPVSTSRLTPLQFPDVLNSKMPSGVAIVTKANLAI